MCSKENIKAVFTLPILGADFGIQFWELGTKSRARGETQFWELGIFLSPKIVSRNRLSKP